MLIPKAWCWLQLGLFAGGLSSFLSSDEDSANDPDEPEEAATAGMEVTALGVQIRPFVFFSGQGELMGHVWSGSGSEKTPAFQVKFCLMVDKKIKFGVYYCCW